MGSEAVGQAVGPRARLALAAALGTGVVLGAAGLVVYQVLEVYGSWNIYWILRNPEL